MSTVNGESEIGSVTGIAMAASEETVPFPSVEVPESADILPSEKKELTADNLFDRLSNLKTPSFCVSTFLEPSTQRKVRVIYR